MANEKPWGLHPKVVKDMYGVHLRTIFRWVKKGFLLSVEGKILTSSVEETLPLWNNSVSKRQARQVLGVRANTIQNWKEHNLLTPVTVMGEERILKESLKNPPKKMHGVPLNGRGHRSISYMVSLLGSSHRHITKYLGKDIAVETIDCLPMVPLCEVERVTSLLRGSYSVRESAGYLGKTRSYVEKMISAGELESFKFLGRTRVTKSSLLSLLKKSQNPIWLREKKTSAGF